MALDKKTTARAGARVEDRQGQLLDIAGRLFAKHGFQGTSLREIAEEAKITKAALYYHFPNKEALYERIVLHGLEMLLEYVMSATAQETTAVDKVRAFMLSTADYYTNNRDAWITGSNAFHTTQESISRTKGVLFRDQYEKHLRHCIQQGVNSGEFRDVDPAIAGRLLLSSINSMWRWHKAGGPLNARQVVEQFLDILMVGMRAKPAGSASTRKTAASQTPRA
ncbi:TetR/AcrR family transcriptional regulator [Ottowia thiooxydans]|uniref:TetR/AcrR family transcriptional regulator n=1 Tax=Ottowia thiooxydans TaxID=219182 RepID=UPI0004064F04|nr:TetR/AcrR family transcriptional regulator [Ottowia thiooxydans]